MTVNISEEEQRALFIEQWNCPNTKLVCEVPVFCRSVDLVEYNSKDSVVTSIEFKTSNWRRAIEQVLSTSISFDYMEICVRKPKTEASINRMKEECKAKGIGIYFFDVEHRQFEHYLLPKKMDQIYKIEKMKVIDYIKMGYMYERNYKDA